MPPTSPPANRNTPPASPPAASGTPGLHTPPRPAARGELEAGARSPEHAARQALRRRLLPAPYRGLTGRDGFVPQRSLRHDVRTYHELHGWLAEGALANFPPLGHAAGTGGEPGPAALAVPPAPRYRDAVLSPPRFREGAGLAHRARVAVSLPGLPPATYGLEGPLSEEAILRLEHFLSEGGDPLQLHFHTEHLMDLVLSPAGRSPRSRPSCPAYESCAPTQLTRQQQADDVCCVTKEPFAEIERPVAVRTGAAVHLFGYARLAEWWQDHQTNPATTLPLPAEGWLRVLPEPSDDA